MPTHTTILEEPLQHAMFCLGRYWWSAGDSFAIDAGPLTGRVREAVRFEGEADWRSNTPRTAYRVPRTAYRVRVRRWL